MRKKTKIIEVIPEEICSEPIVKTEVKPVIVTPIIVTEVTPETIKGFVIKEKKSYTNIPVKEGYIRCVVLKDYLGMTTELKAGEVIDLPERRFKSLHFRGCVDQYFGNEDPVNKR